MKALSIKQPWAKLIALGFKDIENRKWKTSYRGKILIHAGKKDDDMEATNFIYKNDLITDKLMNDMGVSQSWEKGGIVGEVEIIDCVTESSSPWFTGPYGFVLKNARPLPFRPMAGKLNLFNVEREDYMPKVMCFVAGTRKTKSAEETIYIIKAIAEDGTLLKEIAAVSVKAGKDAIGITSDVNDHIYKQHYPNGFDIVWKDQLNDKELKDVLNLYRKKIDAEKEKAKSEPGVDIKKKPERKPKKDKTENQPADAVSEVDENSNPEEKVEIEPELKPEEFIESPEPEPEKKTEDQKQDPEQKIFHVNLPVPYSDTELVDLGKRLSKLIRNKDQVEKSKKAAMDDYKSQLSELDEAIGEITDQFNTPNRMSTVACEAVRDEDGKIVQYVRKDTGEILDSHFEVQLNLESPEPENPENCDKNKGIEKNTESEPENGIPFPVQNEAQPQEEGQGEVETAIEVNVSEQVVETDA